MATRRDYLLAFNRGVLSPLARYRADVKRIGMSAQKQMNWIPRTMGPMSIRPGFRFIGSTATADGVIKHLPFVFSNSDTAIIEITDEQMRVRVDEELITRPAISTTLANGTFDTDLASWTDADQGSAVSAWETGGYMGLTGTGTNGAIRYQELTVASAGVEHALRIVVNRGTVGLRVGTTVDLDDYVTETYLGVGQHSLAFTPTAGSIFVLFFNRTLDTTLVDSCELESNTIFSFATGLLPSETLDELRYTQSGDVIFIARGTTREPAKIERRGTRSWSLVSYESDNGPFLAPNITPVTLTPSALTGQITLTASQNLFKSTNVRSLYRITSTGQQVTAALGALDDVTDPIRVTGILESRRFTIDISGTWAGTIVLQQSLVEPGSWTDVPGQTWTANVTTTYLDGLDNQIVHYRLKMSAFTSGSATATLAIATGSITGIVRIRTVSSPTVATAFVLKALGNVTASDDWSEGAWSDRRGFPSAVAFFGARLFWAGKDKVWGSVVDDFTNFDPDFIGDAGPINRSIGTGPVDTISWLTPLRVLVMGAQGAEYTCRSTGFEEPLTPTNFNLRSESTYGADAVEPVKIDNSIIFMDRTGSRAMQIDAQADGLEIVDISILTPEICLPNVKRLAVQRRPDTRVHMIRCDGTAVVMVYDKAEQVNCFITVETEGLIEDVVILPASPEDAVYYTVVRAVDGTLVRYLERWALTSEAIGGTVNKMADSFVLYESVSTDTLTGLDHLEGKTVVAWGNGKDLGSYTVSGGSVTVSEVVTCAVVGLGYHAEYISGKLEFLTAGAEALNRKTKVSRIGLMMQDVHKQGLTYGTDTAHLDNLPLVEDEAVVADDFVWEGYDETSIVLNGTFADNTRLVLRADAPRPCTVNAAVITVDGE